LTTTPPPIFLSTSFPRREIAIETGPVEMGHVDGNAYAILEFE
jgi:hypothetical protein